MRNLILAASIVAVVAGASAPVNAGALNDGIQASLQGSLRLNKEQLEICLRDAKTDDGRLMCNTVVKLADIQVLNQATLASIQTGGWSK